jgi:hypothetical protein
MVKSKKKYYKLGFGLFYLIPVWSLQLFLFLATFAVGQYLGSFLLLLLLFFSITLHKIWVVYFGDNNICSFYIFEGKFILQYDALEMIYYKSEVGTGISAIRLKYQHKNKLKFAKFEVGSYSYMIEVLNFLHERVENGVIKNSDFEKIGIFFIDGKYQKRGIHSKKL